MSQLRLLVVDDHEVVRHGLRLSLELEPDMALIGEARTGEEALAIVADGKPDVVLLDVRLEGADGPEVCRRILEVAPRTAVVMLTNYDQDGFVLRSLMAGAKGYVIKDVQLSELKKMIRSVYRGVDEIDANSPYEATIEVSARSPEELERADDLGRFGDWAVDSRALDYLEL